MEAPWQRVIVLPLDRVIGEEYRVGWAVAAHRALVGLIGYGAPPLVTGAYRPGTARPANRVAVQVLGPETPAAPVRLRDQAGVPGPLCCCSCPTARMLVTWARSTAA